MNRLVPSPNLRQHLLAAAICLAASLVLFGPLVINPLGVLGKWGDPRNDLTAYYAPARQFQQQENLKGNLLPGWDPHLMCGRPFLANPQTAVYYPPNWACDFGPPEVLLSWLTVLHHAFAGMGLYLLCRQLRIGWWPAVLGGVLFATAPSLLAHSVEGHYGQTTCVSWLPWILWAWERSRNRTVYLIATAVCMTLAFFCGHVQELYYAVLLLGWLSLCEAGRFVARKDWKLAVRPLAKLCLIGVFTAGLSCISLLPTYLATKESTRGAGSFDPHEVQGGSVAFQQIVQVVDPLAMGGPGDFRGDSYYWETLAAISTTAFWLVALAFAWRRWRYRSVQYGVATLFFLLLAIGAYSPAYTEVLSRIPGMGMFRIPSRAMFLVSLTLAVLAAIGLDGFLQKLSTLSDKQKQQITYAVAALVLGVDLLAGLAWFLQGDNPDAIVQINWMPFCLVSLLLAGCLLLVVNGRPLWIAVLGMIAVTVGQASYLSWNIMEAHSLGLVRSRSKVVETLAEQNSGHHRVFATQYQLTDDQAIRAELPRLRGYDPLLLQRYIVYLAAIGKDHDVTPAEAAAAVGFPRASYHEHLLQLGGVKYFVDDSPFAPASLEELPDFPRAYVVGNATTWQNGKFIEQLQTLDLKETVILPDDFLGDLPRAEFTPANIVSYEADRVVVEVTTSAAGYLVLTDTLAGGWTATINDQPAAILPANIAFRGVPLPKAGKYRVVFEYSPPAFQASAIISLLTLLAMGVWVLRSRRLNASQKESPPADKENEANKDNEANEEGTQ